ncbi:MAG: hypothetical protein K2H64_04020, partial [Desulfovibrio sp.]|nr:hypothetical protein [Desulfovibrio sp.]
MDKLIADAGDARMFILYGGLGGETIELMPEFCAKSRARDIYTVAVIVYPFKFEILAAKADAAIQRSPKMST